MPKLSSVLDKIVSNPVLVRRLNQSGVLKIRGGDGVLVEVPYEKTAAGYINFTAQDETIVIPLPDVPKEQMIRGANAAH